jgi:hypothetical protein
MTRGGHGSLHFVRQRFEMSGEPREQLALRWICGQISDQAAFGCVGAKLFQMNLHVLHLGTRKPGDESHLSICIAVPACRALRINISRSAPCGNFLASNRSRDDS